MGHMRRKRGLGGISVFGGGKKTETKPTVEKTTADMRKAGEIIKSILVAVDIEESALSEALKSNKGEGCVDCDEELMRKMLIEELEKAPLISDDMRAIDEYMVKFAQYYQDAANAGWDNVLHWSANALYRGLRERQNLPRVAPEFREKELLRREALMKAYDNLICAWRAMDDAQRNFNLTVANYRKQRQTLDELCEEIKQYIATPEGGEMQGELDTNPTQANGMWPDDARRLNSKYNKVILCQLDVIQSNVWMGEQEATLGTHESQIQLFSQELRQFSDIYGEALAAEQERVLQEQEQRLKRSMAANNAVRRRMREHTAHLEALATQSTEALERGEWTKEGKNVMLKHCEEQRQIQMAGESPYAYLTAEPAKETVQNTQRVAADMG